MGRRVVAAVGHVFAGAVLEHVDKAQRHAPLEKEPLFEGGAAAATPAAVLTPGQSRGRQRLWNEVVYIQECTKNDDLLFTLNMTDQ